MNLKIFVWISYFDVKFEDYQLPPRPKKYIFPPFDLIHTNRRDYESNSLRLVEDSHPFKIRMFWKKTQLYFSFNTEPRSSTLLYLFNNLSPHYTRAVLFVIMPENHEDYFENLNDFKK